MKNLSTSLYSTTAVGLALVLANPAVAQTPQPTAPAAAPEDKDAIVVTGFRAALRSATARKKKAETVVESVSSEDIGKLPDNSIGESIARLPGLASQRSAGRANIISIRGFGPDFSTTTLNGRQQTTSNDSRAVEFDQYPSEILAGVDVYKTTEADHTAGGLVGSIDLRTLRPLEVGHRVLAVGGRAVYVDQKLQPKSKDKGFRVFGSYVDQFADGRVGVALSAAYTSDPYQTRDWNAWSYSNEGYPGAGPNDRALDGIKTWFESDQLKRLGLNGTIEAKLSDNLTVSVDGFYSKFKDYVDKRGFEMPFKLCCGHSEHVSTTFTPEGDALLATSGTVRGTPVIENYAIDRDTKQLSLGGNAAWDGHNGWKALADVSYSRTTRRDHNLETTAGLGRALPNATATVSYQFTNHGPEFTSDYNGASSALVLTDVEGWSSSPIQAGYDKVRKSHDDLTELRGEIEREVGGGFIKSIKIGADYTDRKKTVSQDEAFLSPPNGAVSAAIPTNYLLPPTTLDRGLGPIVSYDPRAIVAGGVLQFIPNPYGAFQGYNVSEKVWTPYAIAPIEADLGAAHLTGNIGVQGIHTAVKSVGFSKPTLTDSYWMVLPSLNLNFRFPNDVVVRFAASKQMMRPRLDALNNNVGFGVDPKLSPPIYVGGGGNPRLRPYQAKAIDLNIEKYFGTKGYIAVQTFYKHLHTYVDSSAFTNNFDYSIFPAPPGQLIIPSSPIGRFSGPLNTHGGKLYGIEIAGTLPFDTISSALGGFGLTGGLGYTKTSVKRFNGEVTEIPGYSKFVGNVTAFYEANGFNARGSLRHRSGFSGDFVDFNGQFQHQHIVAENIYDAQLGYDFQKGSALQGLSIYFQGQNLTNEREETVDSVIRPDAINLYQTYGRRFLAGFTYKF